MAEKSEKKQALMEHLVAMRNMLLVSVGAILVAFVVIFGWLIDPIMHFIEQPLVERGISIIFTQLSEGVMAKLKISLIAALVVACPVIIWQVWRFISPALYAHEKRAFWAVVLISVALFITGVVFCYGAVYVLTVEFFISMGEGFGMMTPTLSSYIDNLFGFVLPFGLAFELPVALYITTKLGLTNHKMLASKRKYVILAAAVVAAVLTPPDVVSQVMLLMPILLLYEVSLLVVRFVKPKEADEAAA